MLVPSASRPGILVSPTLAGISGLMHGFTTRELGSASGPGRPHATEDDDAVARALGPESARWTRREVEQVHGAGVAGPDDLDARVAADALVTRSMGDLLVVRTADCLPVLVASVGAGRVLGVAAVHCGWRGLVAGVLEAALDRLGAAAPGGRMVAALGPCIGACCFEVGPAVADALSSRFGSAVTSPGTGDRSFADLPGSARHVLASRGVDCPDGDAPPCTLHAPRELHSHRGHGAAAGRMGAFCGFHPA